MSFRRFRLTAAFVLGIASGVAAQPSQSTARNGSDVYRQACAACHGPDGQGTPVSQLGFTEPEMPDFTDCRFSSPEPDPDWAATVHLGGGARAFSELMPSFTDALTGEEIERVVAHLRTFCADRRWPRGDLNLPRAFITEKAFPENEAVFTTTFSASGSAAVESEVLYEQRIGARSQYELVLPVSFLDQGNGQWSRGVGDVAVAIKHALFDSLARGTIVSAGAEVAFPTGRESSGLGRGHAVAEGFAILSQMLPREGFLHMHSGVEFPVRSDEPDELFWRAALGKTISQNRWGRAWSPMVEVVTARELTSGGSFEWDVVPQMQVSLSTRQHILVNVGVRVPVHGRSGRHATVMTYLLWDWFDGGLFSGW